jgi:hypothetical protein
MARTPTNYVKNTQLSTTPVDIVPAVASGVQSVVSKLSFYNTSATETRQVTVYVVENGGTADTGNTLVVRAVGPGKSWNNVEILREVFVNGMKAQASVDAGSDVNVNCSGDNFS